MMREGKGHLLKEEHWMIEEEGELGEKENKVLILALTSVLTSTLTTYLTLVLGLMFDLEVMEGMMKLAGKPNSWARPEEATS